MNTKTRSIVRKLILHVVVIFVLSTPPFMQEVVKASTGGATQFRMNSQSAIFVLDEGDRYISLTVIRDQIANTTSLFYGYRFPDPTDSNQTIFITGDEGEIPNSAFSINSTSAHLTVTTPDTYPVTRCVVNNETLEFTCTPTSPSTFDLTWIADGSWMLHERSAQVETLGDVTTRVRGQFNETAATVSGTWDGYSGTSTTGVLIDSENSTLFQEFMMEANFPLNRLLVLQARMDAMPTPSAKGHIREAFSFIESDGGGGLVRVWRDEITNTTYLRFSYSFRESNDWPVIVYMGLDEIPNSAFSINASSARLTVTTPDSYFVLRCVLTGVVGEPGTVTCAPSTTPVMFDVTWIKDGYGSLHETGTRVETTATMTTRYQRQFNRVTAPASGSWSESTEHAGINMTGYLFNIQDTMINHTNP